MRRKHTGRGILLSLLIGCLLGLLAGLAHVQSVQEYRQQTAASLPSKERTAQHAETWKVITPVIEEEPDPDPEPYNDPDIPDEVEAAAEAAAEAYGFAPEFLEAIAFYESSYNPNAENGGCYGLMQVATRWHWDRMERLGISDAEIWEPGPNMMVAADYLAELFSKHEDPNWVLMTYNGDGNASDYLEGRADPSNYARRVLELTAELLDKHGTSEGGEAYGHKK